MDADPTRSEEDGGGFDEELRRLARRLSPDAATADDLLQEAWLAGHRKRPDAVSRRKSWFAAVLVNLARMRWRSQRSRATHERNAARPERWEPADADSDSRDLARLRASVATLKEPYREVIELHYYEARSFQEMSAILGRPEATLRSQHARALELLRSGRAGRMGALTALIELVRPRRTAPDRAAAVLPGTAWILRWLLPATAALIVTVLLFRMADGDRGAETELALEPLETGDALPFERTEAGRGVAGGRTAAAGPMRDAIETLASSNTPHAGHPASALPAGRRLQVAVRDVSGAPIPLARVVLRSGPRSVPRRWTTDESGIAEIPVDEADALCDAGQERIQLAAFADGWASRFEHGVALGDETRTRIELFLDGLEMRLKGCVIDARGQPLPGLVVVAMPERPETLLLPDGDKLAPVHHSAETQADGRFTIAWIPREPRRLEVRRKGICVHAHTVEPARAREEIAIRLDDPATLSGTLLCADGRPAGGAKVVIERYADLPSGAFEADEQGRFRAEGLRPGWMRAWALLGGPANETATEVFRIEPGRERTWDAELAPRPPLALRLVDADGAPIACARIEFVRWARAEDMRDRSEETHLRAFDTWTRAGLTDDRGGYVLHPAPELPLEARVFLPGLSPTLPAHVEAGLVPGPGERTLRIDAIGRPARLFGRVVAARGPLPAGTLLEVVDRRTRARTHAWLDPADGSFCVEKLPPSTFALTATILRQGSVDLGSVEIGPGESLDAGRLELPAMARLRVRSTWPEDPSGSRRFSLAQQTHRDDVVIANLIDTGSAPPEAGWELLPGIYSLHVREGVRAQQFRVCALPPGSDLTIDSGPADRFTLPLRITGQRAGAAQATRVSIQRVYDQEIVEEHAFEPAADGACSGSTLLEGGVYRILAEGPDGLRGEVEVHLGEDEVIRCLEIALL